MLYSYANRPILAWAVSCPISGHVISGHVLYTLVNSCYLEKFQIVGCTQINNLLIDKEQFSRESCGLKLENKLPNLKRSIG